MFREYTRCNLHRWGFCIFHCRSFEHSEEDYLCVRTKFNEMLVKLLPVAVAALFNAWVCGRSLAGIAGSNPSGGMDVCLL
jgi:hypothetical protein